MVQTLLINEQNILQFRTIASSVNEAKRVTMFIYEAQVFDVKPLLGAPLYDDLIANYLNTNYQQLLHGEIYTDPQGYTVNYEGLGACLAYYAYARFLENQQITVTSHSVVTKESPYSQPVDSKILSQRVSQARSGALLYWQQVEKYLYDKNYEDINNFPLWLKSIERKPRQSGARISSVDGFKRRYSYGSHSYGCGCGYCTGGVSGTWLTDEDGNNITTEDGNNLGY